MSNLIELSTTANVSREEAAARLRTIADHLERHNDVEFNRDGRRYVVDVADQVEFEVEFEVAEDGSELEIEISW